MLCVVFCSPIFFYEWTTSQECSVNFYSDKGTTNAPLDLLNFKPIFPHFTFSKSVTAVVENIQIWYTLLLYKSLSNSVEFFSVGCYFLFCFLVLLKIKKSWQKEKLGKLTWVFLQIIKWVTLQPSPQNGFFGEVSGDCFFCFLFLWYNQLIN